MDSTYDIYLLWSKKKTRYLFDCCGFLFPEKIPHQVFEWVPKKGRWSILPLDTLGFFGIMKSSMVGNLVPLKGGR